MAHAPGSLERLRQNPLDKAEWQNEDLASVPMPAASAVSSGTSSGTGIPASKATGSRLGPSVGSHGKAGSRQTTSSIEAGAPRGTPPSSALSAPKSGLPKSKAPGTMRQAAASSAPSTGADVKVDPDFLKTKGAKLWEALSKAQAPVAATKIPSTGSCSKVDVILEQVKSRS
eukprot:Skav207611  [mRNA]  locus=scaffold1878:54633:66805:+ [translate_table: standard]